MRRSSLILFDASAGAARTIAPIRAASVRATNAFPAILFGLDDISRRQHDNCQQDNYSNNIYHIDFSLNTAYFFSAYSV